MPLLLVLFTLAAVGCVAVVAHDSVNHTTAPASSQNTNAVRHSAVTVGDLEKGPTAGGQVGGASGRVKVSQGLREGT